MPRGYHVVLYSGCQRNTSTSLCPSLTLKHRWIMRGSVDLWRIIKLCRPEIPLQSTNRRSVNRQGVDYAAD